MPQKPTIFLTEGGNSKREVRKNVNYMYTVEREKSHDRGVPKMYTIREWREAIL